MWLQIRRVAVLLDSPYVLVLSQKLPIKQPSVFYSIKRNQHILVAHSPCFHAPFAAPWEIYCPQEVYCPMVERRYSISEKYEVLMLQLSCPLSMAGKTNQLKHSFLQCSDTACSAQGPRKPVPMNKNCHSR